MKRLTFLTDSFRRHSSNVHCSDVSHDRRLTVGSPSGFNANSLLKLVSVLVLVLTIGVGNAWGDTTATLTLSSSNKFSTSTGSQKTDNQSNTWTCTGSGIQDTYNTTYSGQQFGTNSTHVTHVFSCTISNATITSVKATMASGKSLGSYAIKIGGVTKYSGSLSQTSTPYGGTSATGTGEIQIELIQASSGTKCATYLGSIEVKYTTAACTATPSIGAASLNGSFTLSSVGVSCASSSAGTNCSITEYGWVWSDGTSNTNPTIGGTGVTNSPKTTGAPSGSGGSFSGTLSGTFQVGHTYYYKAYVTNGKPATTYSTVQSFTPRQITFHKNDGTSSTSTQIVKNGVATNLTANSFSRTGYTFNGWNTQADGKGTDKANQASVTVSGGNLDLYAKWTKNSYTLTWNLNGGTVSVAGTGAAVNATGSPSSSVPYGDAITAPTVTKTGYTFSSWNSTPASTMPASNTTYTAQWTANKYDITYKDQGGGDFTGTQNNAPTKHTYGTATTLKIPTKTGYTFGGWFTTSACSAGSEVGNTTSASLGATAYTAAITLYAKWTVKNYTLTWTTNGDPLTGNYTGKSGKVDFGTTIVAPNTPTKTGYTFNGWTPAVAETMPATDVTYTATWNAKSFTVTWMVNGVEWSGKGGSTSVNFGSHVAAIPSTAPNPKEDACGDRFMGWTTDKEFELGTSPLFTTAGEAPTVTVEGNVIYYAVFADYAE